MRHKTVCRLPRLRLPLRIPTVVSPELRAISRAALSCCLAWTDQNMKAFWMTWKNRTPSGKRRACFGANGVRKQSPLRQPPNVCPHGPGLLLSSLLIPTPPPTLQSSGISRGEIRAYSIIFGTWLPGFPSTKTSSLTFRQAKALSPYRVNPLAPQACASGGGGRGGGRAVHPPPRTRPRLTFPGKPLQ